MAGLSFSLPHKHRPKDKRDVTQTTEANHHGDARRLSSHGCAAPGIGQDKAGLRYNEIPSGAYAVVAEVRAKPGMEDALREATLPLVPQVRIEPNNLLYFLHENREAPGHFIFYEIFASQADFEAHNATPHLQAWFARLPELADGGVTVLRMEPLGNSATFPP